MVYPWTTIHGMETERICLVDRRKTYVLVTPIYLPLLMATGPDFVAGSGKSVLWYV
jgi:hypothetical protein